MVSEAKRLVEPLRENRSDRIVQSRPAKRILRASFSDNSLLTQLVIHLIEISRLVGLTHASISDGLNPTTHAHLTARTRDETTSRAEDIRSDHRQAEHTQTKTYPTARRTMHHVSDDKAG